MVMVVRTPDVARRIFTANQLCAWPNGIAYTDTGEARRKQREERRRRRREHQQNQPDPQPPEWLNQEAEFGKDVTG